jgi:prepilin-type N-terminal cleavage/methylation domain-containing protein/prepilin-type processing-associated H-X9-DG protein
MSPLPFLSRPPRRPHRFRVSYGAGRGFTLIELLVVISIIVLLISISLPSIGKAKNKATTAVCGTRLRALGQAMQTYLSENDETFPVNGIILPKSGIPTPYANVARFTSAEVKNQDKWRIEYGALYSYMGGVSPVSNATLPLPPTPTTIAKAYLCPVDTQLNRDYDNNTPGNGPLTLQAVNGGNPKVMVGKGEKGYWSYSVNAAVNSLGRMRNNFTTVPWVDPLKKIRVKRTSDFLVFIEEDNASLFNDEVFDAPAYNNGDKLTNRHEGSGNVAFADWHVEKFNEVLFDQVPQAASSGSEVSHSIAMQSPITRMFFPDSGEFANTGP